MAICVGMKIFRMTLWLPFLIWASSALAERPVVVEFFVVPGCDVCEEIKTFVVPDVEARFGEDLVIQELSIDVDENYLKLAAYQDRFGADPDDKVSMVLSGRRYVGGRDNITTGLVAAIEQMLVESYEEASAVVDEPDGRENLRRRADEFTAIAVLAAGLTDGVNPCAFAAAILLVSLMTTGGRDRRVIFCTGVSFCLAVFLTYFLLGLGAFSILNRLSDHPTADLVLKWGMVLFLAVLAVISAWDAAIYARHRDPGRIVLQLPDHMKDRLRTMARSRIRSGGAIVGGFTAGVVVTLIESVCTGQVYLPTLTLLARQDGDGRTVSMLLLYNLAFVIPLIVVFLAAFSGASSARLADWSRKNVIPAKILLALFFAAMAVLTFAL